MKNKFLKKVICVGLLSFSLLGFNSIGANAETTQNSNHYNQWIQVNGNWEYYNSLGQPIKDEWIKSFNGKYYYLDNNGIMLTNKWIEFEEKDYYVDADGVWVSSNVLKTNENTYIKNKQTDIKKIEEDKIKKDNINTNSLINKTASESSSSNNTSLTSNDYYDYSSKGSNETYVSGYYRNGKYVSGHYRTKKDSTTSNNYSHKGNTNPHNGKKGYKK